MKKMILATAIFALATVVGPSAFAQRQTDPEKAQMNKLIEMLRKDVRTDVHAIFEGAMGLETADKAKFWTVFAPYETQTKGLWDRRIAGIKKYADNYTKMTPAVAAELGTTVLAIEQDTATLRKATYGKMSAALGPIVAARFLQLDYLIGHLLGIQMGADLPLMN